MRIADGETKLIIEEVRSTRDAAASLFFLGEGARLQYVLFLLGGRSIEKTVEVILGGSGSQADIHGLFIGAKDERLYLTSLTRHDVPHTRARVQVDAVLAGQSQFDYNGMIKILKTGQQTDSYLASHTLLLSEDCRANAIPALEIEANDVHCSHEVTVAPVSKEQMFYLQSRGLRAEEAEDLLVRGFMETTLTNIKDEQMKNRIRAEIERKLRS
ncbi:MAG: SufD family Fe-S cluster assembly protein [bacterium]|nr:SufD family Fe-S cluster assembly protein [bacterium]